MIKNKVPHLKEERKLWQEGYKLIAGVDESGCGPWAGPVVGAAVILPFGKRIKKIRDCKVLTQSQRIKLYNKIQQEAIALAVAFISVAEIDKLGIRKAALLAMQKAVEQLKPAPDFLLIDAFNIKSRFPQKALIGGDNISLSIAAASIIAKVERDKIMESLHFKYPLYGFDKHKGYGTKLHQAMITKYGPCEIHRKSFSPFKKYLN